MCLSMLTVMLDDSVDYPDGRSLMEVLKSSKLTDLFWFCVIVDNNLDDSMNE